MASTTFPLAQAGSFSGPGSTMHFETAQLSVTTPAIDTTGTGSADKRSVTGFSTGDVVAIGHIENSGAYGLAEDGSISGPLIRCRQFAVRRVWPLFDVTGSSGATKDLVKQWKHGHPLTTISVVGVAYGNLGAGMNTTADETKKIAISIVINEFGTLTGDVNITQKQVQASFRDGGPIGAAMAGQFTGTAAGISGNFAFMFPTGTPDEPTRGALVLDINSGTTIAENALCYDITVTNPSSIGGPIPVQARFRFD